MLIECKVTQWRNFINRWF